uniref:NlpC/P60 family protein n=1 Tax=Gallaecimonas sp. GXIMD4217 TaxID=3131927 RepID=UPI00404982AA
MRKLLPLLVILSGCTVSPQAEKPPSSQVEGATGQAGIQETPSVIDALNAQYRQWRGVRYRLGGTDRTGIDCSAFVQRTFAERFGLILPRQTREQVGAGQPVARRALKTGDLVLFKTGRHSSHVGIYLEEGLFLHASTTEGVTLSSLHNPYWHAKYWTARRLALPQ